MPELPEVETIARGVDLLLRGDQIVHVRCSDKPEPFKTPPGEMAAALPGRVIGSVHRVGKHIVFTLVAGPDSAASHDVRRRETGEGQVEWVVHLGMTGRLLVTAPEAPVPVHTHCILSLASGRELRFVDPRRFGRLSLLHGAGTAPLFVSPGQEPLLARPEEFRLLFHRHRTSIKAALLNQKLLAGVGNIYADESLFRAGVRPRRAACRLSRKELERLRQSLQQVLRRAIRMGGSSVSDYVDATGERGLFQIEHMVYGRTGKPCRVCGAPIRRIVVAGRGTHYCPHCQR